MPVHTRHESYKKRETEWLLCRAVIGGELAVKDEAVREKTLPPLSGHKSKDDKRYKSYVASAHLFPGAGRYRDGLFGLLFKVRPAVEVPDGMSVLLDDVTGGSSPCGAEEFLRSRMGGQTCTVGRHAVLVDWPSIDDDEAQQPRDLSQAQVERRGEKPTWTLYKAEQVINWDEERFGGMTRTTLVVLEEKKTVVDKDDRFVRKTVDQWRVLELVKATPEQEEQLPPEERTENDGPGMVYRVQIERLKEGKSKKDADGTEVVSERYPMMQGNLMHYIPCKVVNGEDCELDPKKPVLLDIVMVNLGHLRNSASYEHGLKYVGSPQPWATGYDKDQELEEGQDGEVEWTLGSSRMLTIKSDKAKLGILSLKDGDLGALEKAMERKQQEMVVIGGRILAQDKLAAEAARTEELRQEGERGVVATIGSNLSDAATQLLEWSRDWMGLSGEVVAKVQSDPTTPMSPTDAMAWSEMVMRGHLPLPALWNLLRRGMAIPSDWDDEDIVELILANPPGALLGAEPLPGDDPPPRNQPPPPDDEDEPDDEDKP